MYTKELIQKATQVESPEELAELSKGTENELTLEEAREAFAKLHTSGEISDDDLDNVAGGCGSSEPSRPARANIFSDNPVCPYCGTNLRNYSCKPGEGYDLFGCFRCNISFRHYFKGDEWTVN